MYRAFHVTLNGRSFHVFMSKHNEQRALPQYVLSLFYVYQFVLFQAYTNGPVKQYSIAHVIVQLYLINISIER